MSLLQSIDIQLQIYCSVSEAELKEALSKANDPEEYPGEEPVTLESLRDLAADEYILSEFIGDAGPILSSSGGALIMEETEEYLEYLVFERREELSA